ncbi:hypothetical protein [Planomicrobium sp. YIM 101495]|uniref:hypothetical protein n=1 Tax=Planomicrobium sp. YIM 101495 TaxID=2665160 RepID=UPI0012B7B10A|nr:hypothetical protein [Planomicrobium sp. YIM 101495]MTD31858.1 hypothetical protein [Planomicrobium sp. YIM 101495]
MKIQHPIVTGSLITLLVSMLFPLHAQATSWAYPFVVWDDALYVTTKETVENVGEKIGEVTAYSDMEQLSGNFSNTYQEGTAYYKIDGVPTDEAIAVEDGGTFVKAVWESAYTYKQPIRQMAYWALGVLVALAAIAVLYSITRKSAAE